MPLVSDVAMPMSVQKVTAFKFVPYWIIMGCPPPTSNLMWTVPLLSRVGLIAGTHRL